MLARLSSSLPALGCAALFAALAPLLVPSTSAPQLPSTAFPGWPEQYEGRRLHPLPLSARERGFVRDFPGQVGRFSDGEREIIVRWLHSPSRRLHPAADCFQGIGYSITPLPLQRNAEGTAMGCFSAGKSARRLRVCEYITDGAGNSWSDVSAWYWQAILNRQPQGWWSFVVAERL